MVRRIALSALITIAAGFALVGLVWVPASLLVALLLGPVGGLIGFAATRGAAADVSPARQRQAVITGRYTGALTVGAVLVIAGMGVMLGDATLPLLVVVALLLSPWGWMRLRSHLAWPRARHALAHPDSVVPDVGSTPASSRQLVSLPIAALCSRWQASYHALHAATDHATREGIIAVRRALLDELERRDPAAVAQWLRTESRPAATSPRRHFTSSAPAADTPPPPPANGQPDRRPQPD